MAKKKMRDCTVGELKQFCKSQDPNLCSSRCPFADGWACTFTECPAWIPETMLEKELDLQE